MLLSNSSLTFGGNANFDNGVLSMDAGTSVTGGSISLTNSTIGTGGGTFTTPIYSVDGDNRIVAADGKLLTLGFSGVFGVLGTSTLHFGYTNNLGTVTFEGASNLNTSSAAKIVIDGGTLQSGASPDNHALSDLTSTVQSVTVAAGGMLFYRENLRPDSVAIRDLQGAGTVAVGEGGSGVLGITQGNFSGQIQTSNGLRVMGGNSGTLILTGNQVYDGGTTIDAGHTLQLGNHTTTGSIIGDVINNGQLVFLRSDNLSFDGVISGTGGVENRTGELTLTGINTYQGGTRLSGGTIVVSRDENLGAASGGITFGGDFATLKFASGFTINRNIASTGIAAGFDTNGNDATLGGVISGSGGLFKEGLGTLTLTNTSTYSGLTEVIRGGLRVNGSIAGSEVTVDTQGWLGGTGTVGSTTVYGALVPGNSIGTLNVNGSLAFQSGSAYLVQLSPTASATGAVTIDAGSTAYIGAQAGTYVANRYTIIDGASRTGTFDQLVLNGGNSFGNLVTNPHLEYDASHVYFVLDPAKLTALLPTNASQNQSNVVKVIDKAYSAGGSSPIVGALFGASGNALLNGLNQASGEVATGLQQAAAQSMGSFLGLMLDPFAPTRVSSGFGAAVGYAPEQPKLPQDVAQAYAQAMPGTPPVPTAPTSFEQRWSMWGAGYGGQARFNGNDVVGSQTTTSRAYGLAVGADYRPSPFTTFGFAVSGGATNWGLANAFGSGKSDTFQAGGYAAARLGGAYLAGAAAYAWHGVSTERTVTVIGTDRLEARLNAQSWGGRVEAGYRFGTPGFGVTPYAAGQAVVLKTPSYGETSPTGANAFALDYGGQTTTMSRSELGSWIDGVAVLDAGANLLLRTRVAWAHNFNTDRNISAIFLTLPGTSFTVGGAAPAVNTALVSGAAELRLASGWSIGGRFDGEFGRGTSSYAGTGTVRVAW
jgi:autotransporter-associated beta strand protein